MGAEVEGRLWRQRTEVLCSRPSPSRLQLEEISCIPRPPETKCSTKKEGLHRKSKVMSALLLRMLGRGCLLLPLLPKTPLNHSPTKPPPFLSVALAEVVSKQPPSLDWLWSLVSPSLAILSLLSLLLWPLGANLSRQPSLVFSNSPPKFSLATRIKPYDIGRQYLLIMLRIVGIYRPKLATVIGWMWELRSSVHT